MQLRLARALLLTLIAVTLPFSGTPQRASSADRVTIYDTFETDQPVVALTFDVTFDRGDGAEVLDILAQNGIPATFAVTGVWAESNPDLMYRIVNEGHQLINHTWSHPSLTGEFTGSRIHEPRQPLTREEVIEQIELVDRFVREQFGIDMRPYLRPPYGDYDDNVLAAMADTGYTLNIMWTIDTFGWYGDPVDVVTQRALDAAQPGANILMHIGHGSTDGEALPDIIAGYREMGYEFATVADFVEGRVEPPEPEPVARFELSGDFLGFWWRIGGIVRAGIPLNSR